MTAKDIRQILQSLAIPEIAEHAQRFFKTGAGQYSEGDLFLGIRVPKLRELAKEFRDSPLGEARRLLRSVYHEERLFALLLLVQKYERGNAAQQKAVYDLYLKNTRSINNWDLVDLSAHRIVGPYLMDRDRQPLYVLAQSASLWERRIAIISTFHFIKKNQFADTLRIAGLLLTDREDLMHKAAGWMLREVGKRNLSAQKEFLNKHYRQMPRTMLRYAIEKFSEEERLQYLKGLVAS